MSADAPTADEPAHEPFLARVRLKNYKSVASCDVALGRFTLLVGRNGSGKSNFLDALAFTADALNDSLDRALRTRGGFAEVRRRSRSKPTAVTVSLHLNLTECRVADYEFVVGARAGGGYGVNRESLKIRSGTGRTEAEFRVKSGAVKHFDVPPVEPGQPRLDPVIGPLLVQHQITEATSRALEGRPPVPTEDRLFLVRAAGFPQFREAFDALSGMSFYNLNPEHMRELQSPAPGRLLRSDGANVASVVARLEEEFPDVKRRIGRFLGGIVPGVDEVSRRTYGTKETLRFEQRQGAGGGRGPKRWTFDANGMSDGTLRALGILVAAMQRTRTGEPVRLIGIEEPETALHAAAAGVLLDALREAAERTQILVTTHSADLLDLTENGRELLVVAQAKNGATRLGRPDAVGRQALQEHLATAGELLRMDQLRPESDEQAELFAEAGTAGDR